MTVRTPAPRGLALLTVGQTISAFGDAFVTVALPLLILDLTGSVAKMGLLIGLSAAGQLAGSLLAGSIVDRVARVRLAVACDLARMVLYGLVPAMWLVVPARTWSHLGLWLTYAVVTVAAMILSVYEVAFRAALPRLVGRERIAAVNSRLVTATELAYGFGPALAGVTIAAIGEPPAIGVDAITFGVAALAWSLLPRGETRPAEPPPPTARPRLTGLRHVWSDHTLRALGMVEAANALLFAGASTLFIYYVRHDLGLGSTAVGILLAFGSAGAVLAAIVANRARRWLGYGPAVLVAGAVQGLALSAVVAAQSIVVLGFVVALFGFAQILVIILAMSLRQERTPDHVLGRVSAAVLTGTILMRAVGGVTITFAASQTSTVVIFVTLGVLASILSAAGSRTPLGRRESPVSLRKLA